MKSMWDEDASREVRDRVARLVPGMTAQWGRMSAPQMVCHLADSLKMALGDLPVAPKRSPIRYPPLKQLIVYVAPFPKNVPTAPELLARTPGDWQADVADLQALVDRLTARGALRLAAHPEPVAGRASRSGQAGASWAEHPAFGKLSKRAWGVLIYRHMDHHLRQFGV